MRSLFAPSTGCLLCHSVTHSSPVLTDISAIHSLRHLRNLAKYTRASSDSSRALTTEMLDIARSMGFSSLESFRDEFRLKNLILVYNDLSNQEPGAARFSYWLGVLLSQLKISIKGTGTNGRSSRPSKVLLIDDGYYSYISRFNELLLYPKSFNSVNYLSKVKKGKLVALGKKFKNYISDLGIKNTNELNWEREQGRRTNFQAIMESESAFSSFMHPALGPVNLGNNLWFHQLWTVDCEGRPAGKPLEGDLIVAYMQYLIWCARSFDYVVFCKNGRPSKDVESSCWAKFLPIKIVQHTYIEEPDEMKFSIEQELFADEQDCHRCFYERFVITPFQQIIEDKDRSRAKILGRMNEFITPSEMLPSLNFVAGILHDCGKIETYGLRQFEGLTAEFRSLENGLNL